ncbi:MAG: hypothetical protein C0617_12205 [Desulfuromonas sp.]|uniref:hypothetical protein n=1 Tax=Desulfuromonas sp. TaxID=892 RepID=UPI000CB1B3AC|nr:hypothetical protein [Desulfuromonas sp.]PLX83287.1 MAG: hypothetical protein C0617_12205 [Desulfuromonas sp.]
MTLRKTLFCTLLLTLLSASTVLAQAVPGTVRPVKIESAAVVPLGQVALEAGLAFEMDREWQRREYDNVRLAPLGVRYGLAPGLEVGGSLGFSSNDGEGAGAPDDSGLEGLSLFGKMQVNEYAALRAGLILFGDEDVYPYPSDGLDLFADLALQRRIEGGLLYGEIGYTVQGGNLDDNHYFSYGLGYAYPVDRAVTINVELGGEEAHEGTTANVLDLLLGANVLIAGQVRLAPYVSAGLFDSGPDFALGTLAEMRF